MNIKKVFQTLFLLSIVLIIGGTIYYSLVVQRQQQKKLNTAEAQNIFNDEAGARY